MVSGHRLLTTVLPRAAACHPSTAPPASRAMAGTTGASSGSLGGLLGASSKAKATLAALPRVRVLGDSKFQDRQIRAVFTNTARNTAQGAENQIRFRIAPNSVCLLTGDQARLGG